MKSFAVNGRYKNGAILALLVSLTVATGLYSVHLGVDRNWDLQNYHLYNVLAALHNRYFYDVAPAQLQSYFNPLLDLPFFSMIEFFNDWPRVIAFVEGAVHGVSLLCIGLLTWHLLGSAEGMSQALRIILTALALLIGATGAGSAPLIGATTGDLQATAPMFVALLLVIRAIDRAQMDSRRALGAIAIAGVLAGFAAAAKLTMGIYGVAIAVSLFALPRALLVSGVLRFAATGVAGVLFGGGLHFFRMWRLFGNPFFPMFNNVFHSPYWEASAIRDTRFLPKTQIDWLILPFEWAQNTGQSIVSELAFRDIRIALAFTLGGLAALSWLGSLTRSSQGTRVSPGVRALTIFILVAYFIWLPLFSIYRYLVPIELLSGVVIVLALGAIVRRHAWPVMGVAAAGLCIATTVPLDWGHAPFRDRYIEVNAPALAPDTLVVIVGADPVSYFIPFLNRKVRWVSLMNNLLRPDQDNLLMRRARELIKEHRGPLMMLQAGASEADSDATLSRLSLVRGPGECGYLSSNLVAERYAICPISLSDYDGRSGPQALAETMQRSESPEAGSLGAEIVAFGPSPVVHGQPFNQQPGGGSAIWVKLDRAAGQDVTLVFGNEQLTTVVSGDLLTALVPPKLFSAPGSPQLLVEAVRQGRPLRSKPVSFEVQ
jgi:hypothetical protein